MQEEISLKDLYKIIKKHFLTMVIAMLVGSLLSVTFMTFFVTPKYSSEAQLLVNQQGDSSQTQIQYNEVQTNIQLINTYSDIITGHSVLEKVNKNLGGSYSVSQLSAAIKVGQSSNSQAFNLTVTMETAEEAQKVLNQVINIFEETIVEVYDFASILVLSPATYNANKVSPSLTVYILIGALLGFFVSVLIIIIIELMDTSVKDDEFLSEQGIINLGRIYELSAKELKQTRLINSKKENNLRERV
ncbi:hypothetical protein GIY09_01735 [Aerococcaceae bacterium WS4759]|uniref:Capsular polysaccharide biosynthesis protein CpsC n=1 Tax=Fundicoccus ignavus TaxID=2664442 RepID=A0A6I2GA18_9LACT|nr:Wzz/FepE/Etk N-terminal domain-containing protein [Fundicoccus ignavus]MRI84617.1 hypothetical protein [Fundicoccus ignavus]